MPPSDRDREVAEAAIRRWRSFDRRHPKGGDHATRVTDLARGLLERFDPDRMDEPNWHRQTADAVAELLRNRLP